MNIYPAMKASMGRWTYFIVKMTMREIAENVNFANDIYDDKTLDQAIQRVLDESRAKTSIASYLINQPDRFFSSIVVAALQGNPTWYGVSMEDDARFELFKDDQRLSETFGVLRFDGGQDYYALDGQHRLSAIKALVDPQSDLARDAPEGFKNEEVSVIIVMPGEAESDEEFLRRYRRLFGNLNRYAKPMDNVTNIIMDEDDAFAIVTRALIREHEFFRWTGRAKESPRVKMLKGKNLKSSDTFFTSLETLYAMNIDLLDTQGRRNRGWDEAGRDVKEFSRFRPSDEIIEKLSDEVQLYWDCLLETLPQLRDSAEKMRDHAASDETETSDSALFWPIGQELATQLARDLLNRRLPDPNTPTREGVLKALAPLSGVDWEMHDVPWRHILLIPDGDDETTWKIRNEERAPAQKLCKRILTWQIGLESLDADEVSELKRDWESMLLPALTDRRKSELWEEIEAGGVR